MPSLTMIDRAHQDLARLADDPRVRRRVRETFPDVVAAGQLDRRTMLQLVAATLAAGGLSACADADMGLSAGASRWPPMRTGADPVEVATSLDCDGYGLGVIATLREGRTIRLDGNPLHPASAGAIDAMSQAEILALYDPDRSRRPLDEGRPVRSSAGADMLSAWRAALTETRGRGAALLIQPTASPTTLRSLGLLARTYPELRLARWAPLASEEPARGAELAFGRRVEIVHRPGEADTILTVGGDLFGIGPARLRCAADWAKRRRDGNRRPPRLIAAETTPSLAGLRADRRIALSPRALGAFLRDVLAALGGETASNLHPEAVRVAADLRAAGRRALVVIGPEQPAPLHAMAHAIHERLGAFGTTAHAIAPLREGEGPGEIASLAEEIGAGRIERLAVLGGNPAYDAPADLDFRRLLRDLRDSLHLGLHHDETGRLCRRHLPLAHALESFGDARAFDGTVSFRQPTQRRAEGMWSLDEVLAALAGSSAGGRPLLEETWREVWSDASEGRLTTALEAGVLEGSAAEPASVRLRADFRPTLPAAGEAPYELVFAPDPSVHDGRAANNAWLQELPKPVTKQIWGNAAQLGPATARRLGIGGEGRLRIEAGGSELIIPALVVTAHAEGAVTLPLGFGRVAAGQVGDGIGIDVYPLRRSGGLWSAAALLSGLSGPAGVTITQRRFDQGGQPILRHVASHDTALGDAAPAASLYPERPAAGHAWGMAIDLDACIGCNACVVACQAENNVPAVGPAEAARERTMHWLRIDRYDDAFQPVPCMHCETAPCEVVCPVHATVHSSEGLNDMVYARCIGTRACANNCPYSVRRFNYADPRQEPYATPREALNPQVTARGRGVMEKCTFCVQRIAETRIEAAIADRPIADGEIRTACETACPTRAIVFGDLADPNSRVARAQREGRAYALLGEMNTRPRVRYLARVAEETP